jgi:uncharacterized membrane protein
MPETAAFCPGCGRPMQGARAHGRVGVFPENIAGAVAYITLVPAIVFLVLDPYSKNRFLRFHSFQCVLLWATLLVMGIAVKLVGLVLLVIPVLGHLLVALLWMVLGLGAIIVWLVLITKSLQGEAFRIPILGEVAEHLASSY